MNTVPRETIQVERQIEQLVKGCRTLGFELEEEEKQNFSRYLKEILSWNRRINLISRQDTDNIASLHFLDSLSLLPRIEIPPGARVLDVGSGAGFPGLPLKICRQDLHLSLVESTRKKCLFLKHVVETLSLENVTILRERAEDLNTKASFQNRYDMAVSRAVSHLQALVPLCLPFVKPGGLFVAYKGGLVEAELQEAMPRLLSLGSQLEKTEEVLLPPSKKKRQLVIIKKLK